MKYIIAVILLCISMGASAGFVTGYVVGSSGVRQAAGPNTLATSAGHDTIVCCIASELGGDGYRSRCETQGRSQGMSPAQYAGLVGYKTLHSVGYLKTDRGCDMIIMEVSK